MKMFPLNLLMINQVNQDHRKFTLKMSQTVIRRTFRLAGKMTIPAQTAITTKVTQAILILNLIVKIPKKKPPKGNYWSQSITKATN